MPNEGSGNWNTVDSSGIGDKICSELSDTGDNTSGFFPDSSIVGVTSIDDLDDDDDDDETFCLLLLSKFLFEKFPPKFVLMFLFAQSFSCNTSSKKW